MSAITVLMMLELILLYDVRLRRSAFRTTETEEMAMANPANAG